MPDTQNYENPARRTPLYYNVAGLVLFTNIIWQGYRFLGEPSSDRVMSFLLGIALLVAAFAARTQTLTVQNRVIRLEQRLRFQRLLLPEVAARACELPVALVVALRFASDAELPALVDRVRAGQLSDQKAVKRQIRQWQGDFLRA